MEEVELKHVEFIMISPTKNQHCTNSWEDKGKQSSGHVPLSS
jgi:hypothetical protein